jgi:hypothetical protein
MHNPSTRDTVFFASSDQKLSAFARHAYDIRASTVLGVPVEFKKLEAGDIIDEHQFWVVKEIPDELRRMLQHGTNYAKQGTSTYRVSQQRNPDMLPLLKLAEVKARLELFPERYKPALRAKSVGAR